MHQLSVTIYCTIHDKEVEFLSEPYKKTSQNTSWLFTICITIDYNNNNFSNTMVLEVFESIFFLF